MRNGLLYRFGSGILAASHLQYFISPYSPPTVRLVLVTKLRVTTMATQFSGDARNEPRFLFRLAADALVDERECHHGFVKDISVEGATLYIDRNFQKPKSIQLHIKVPPLIATTKPHVVKVVGTIVYSIYDCVEMSFRVGVSFDQFPTPSDRDFLQERLFKK